MLLFASVLKNQNTNLLPEVFSKRVALVWKLPKIKLRFLNRFTKLTIVSVILLTLLGYYPTFAIPPFKKSKILASAEQKGEIIAKSFSQPLILPHPGYLSTRFSSWHPGVDIATGLGMPIHPVTSGKVLEVGRDIFGLGNFVTVIHQNDFRSKYAHMGKIYVKVGQDVTSENILGEVGLTGRTSGPHTHLEITLDGNYIDPLPLLPEIAPMPVLTAVKR